MYGKGQTWNARAIRLGKWESCRGVREMLLTSGPLADHPGTQKAHRSSMPLDILAADTGSSTPPTTVLGPLPVLIFWEVILIP